MGVNVLPVLLALTLVGVAAPPEGPLHGALNLLIGQAAAAENPFRVEVNANPIAPGASGNVEIALRVPQGFHVYRDMMSVEATQPGKLVLGPPVFPPAENKPDPANPGQNREVYEEDVIVTVPVTVPAGATGEQQVFFHVRYQGCKKNLCYMPAEEDVTATIRLAGAAAAPSTPVGDAGAEDAGEPAGGQEDPVHFRPGSPKPGQLVIHADLQGDWHLNRMFMSAKLVEADDWSIGELVLPDGVKTGSEADGTAREDYMVDFDFSAPVTGADSDTTLKVEVGYQACKGISLCLAPTVALVDVPYGPGAAAAIAALNQGKTPGSAPPEVAHASATPAPSPASAAPTGSPDSAFAQAAAQGFGSLLLLCFIAGIGVSFTPCVLPIVPITMGIIGARSAGTRGRAFALASTYVLGQAAVYTGLGLAAAAMGKLFGAWLQSPWIVGGIAVFFFGMGLAMFGFFDIAVPSAITNRLSSSGPRGGFVGAAILGAVGALVAGPCSGPVVASILLYVSVGGSAATGALLMFVFSLGMGMIFLVTGAAMGWLPSRGAWMVTVKKAMGIFLWLAAVWFASPQLSTHVTALLTAAVLLVTAVFAWPSAEDGEGVFVERLRQTYTLVGGLVGAYLLIGALAMQGFILPPLQLAASSGGGGTSVAAGPAIPWLSDHDTAMAQAQASGKPLMIDFTAEWCAACHEMEKYTYTDGAVVKESERFVTVMIDCTNDKDPAIQAIQKRYGVTGLPTVVFVKPDGTKVGETIGFVEAPEFLNHMQRALGAS